MNKGAVDCHKAEYNQESGNANLFMFRDDSWPYENPLDTLALTTLTYNVETAEIFDADVEVNTAEAKFTTSRSTSGETAPISRPSSPTRSAISWVSRIRK